MPKVTLVATLSALVLLPACSFKASAGSGSASPDRTSKADPGAKGPGKSLGQEEDDDDDGAHEGSDEDDDDGGGAGAHAKGDLGAPDAKPDRADKEDCVPGEAKGHVDSRAQGEAKGHERQPCKEEEEKGDGPDDRKPSGDTPTDKTGKPVR